MQLRAYQRRVIDLTLAHLNDYSESCPLISAATGSGKSVMAAALCEELGKLSSGMILLLTHRKELILQDHDKLPHHLKAGIYSAGVGKKQLRKITVASFQSIRRQAAKLPRVDWIIIDEADYAGAGYREFIDTVRESNPDVRVIGMTATPFLGDANRTALHLLPADKRIFTGICAEVGIGELLRAGYLAPLTPYRGTNHIDVTGVQIDRRTGDFAAGALQDATDIPELNRRIAAEMVQIFHDRNTVMVFATGVSHAEHMRDALRELGQSAEMVLGSTPNGERDSIIKRFRAGELKYLVGIDVLLVGFDCARIDALAVLRTTLSARVYVQALGRGMRISPETGKTDCLVADWTDNAETHGPVDEVEGRPPRLKTGEAPCKHCPDCFSICLAGLRVCPTCGFEFPPPEANGDARQFDPTTGMLVSGVVKHEDGSREYPVSSVEYEIRNTKAGAPALICNYMAEGRTSPVAVEYLNLFHHKPAVAQRDSLKWIRRLHTPGPVPLTAQEALARATFGALKKPRTVTVRPGSPFPIKFST